MESIKSAASIIAGSFQPVRHRSATFHPTDLAAAPSIGYVTDGELVERVLAGQTAAFGELVERHRGAIYRAALAALRNPADAEDVAQDALVLAFRKIGQFRAEASVRTWMVTIVWRLALSRRRNPLRRLKQMVSTAELEVEIVSGQPSAETVVLDRESLAAVRTKIGKLSPKLRDALLLAAAGDLTQDEIAATLKIPASTFRWRLMEARRRLRGTVRPAASRQASADRA
jgi:RNA polymerase sigma-70 factor, ECF subfamily